jgi:hypothetical protein
VACFVGGEVFGAYAVKEWIMDDLHEPDETGHEQSGGSVKK